MAKKVYSESVKKWAITSGIAGSSGLALLILWYAVATGAFSVTGYSGDVTCAGNLSDPCYAYINFTANEDVFIYPVGYDPYGRNTSINFDPGLKEWKIQRSWGTGWRDIPLNQTCTGTWCGGKPDASNNQFSVVFRKGQSYQIRIVAFKHNIYDNVKWWGFGAPDPTFKGIEVQKIGDKERLENSKIIIESPYEIKNSGSYNIDLKTKSYNGSVHVLYGFEKDIVPKISLTSVTHENASFVEAEFDCQNNTLVVDKGRAVCSFTGKNGTTILFNESFTRIQNNTILRDVNRTISHVQNFNSKQVNLSLNNRTWSVIENYSNTGSIVLNIRVPIGLVTKYDIAVMPSSYVLSDFGINQALSNGDLFVLDPIINSTRYEIGNLSNASNTWNVDRNTTTSTIYLNTDNKTIQINIGDPIVKSLNTSLARFYSKDRGSGTTSIDSTNTLNGTLGSAVGWLTNSSQCIKNNCTRFNGTAAGTISTGYYFDVDNDGWSIAVFHKFNGSTTNNNLVIGNTNSSYWGYIQRDDRSGYAMQWGGAANYLNPTITATSTNTWRCVAITKTGGRLISYINGSVDINASWSPALAPGSPVWGGFRTGDGRVAGDMDIGAIWSTALNQSQVQAFCNNLAGLDYSSDINFVFNSSNNKYYSIPIGLAINISSFTPTLNYTGSGSVGVNYSCDGGVTWTGEKNTSNGISISCPANGDSFMYELTAFGNSSTTPIIQNLTIDFTQSASATTHSARISPDPIYPYQTMLGYCNASITTGTNLSVYYLWYRNSTLFDSGLKTNFSNNTETNIANVSLSNIQLGDSWTLSCVATDGSQNGTMKNYSIGVNDSIRTTFCNGLSDLVFKPNTSKVNVSTLILNDFNVTPVNYSTCAYQVNLTGHPIKNVTAYLNATHANISIKCVNSTSPASAVVLNTSNKTIGNVFNTSMNVSCWADYSNLNILTQSTNYRFNISFGVTT